MSDIRYGLEGKVAVVTGGSRGIGLEIVRAFIAQGAKVAMCGRKKDALDSAAASLGAGDALFTMPCHVAKEEDVNAFFDAAAAKFGRIDILVNNVGMNLITPSVYGADSAVWQKIIESNLTGTFLCSRKAATVMKEKGAGKIISISSIAGTKASPGMGIYGIAKAGIEMLTKVLASELASFNIQVNAVAPCMVRTEFSKPFWSNKDIEAAIVKTIPLGRIAESVDVVHPVLFLASDGAGFITGQTVMVDGGASVL